MAAEIVEDLQAALAQFAEIASDLSTKTDSKNSWPMPVGN
jgi:hypothetical protein